MTEHRIILSPIGQGETYASVEADGGWYPLLVEWAPCSDEATDRARLESAVRAELARRHPGVRLGDVAFVAAAWGNAPAFSRAARGA